WRAARVEKKEKFRAKVASERLQYRRTPRLLVGGRLGGGPLQSDDTLGEEVNLFWGGFTVGYRQSFSEAIAFHGALSALFGKETLDYQGSNGTQIDSTAVKGFGAEAGIHFG